MLVCMFVCARASVIAHVLCVEGEREGGGEGGFVFECVIENVS